MTKQTYSINELQEKTDEELTSILKQIWGYRSQELIVVFGVVKKILLDEYYFYVIENLVNREWVPILYPLDGQKTIQNCYLGRKLPQGINEFDLVQTEVQLSPQDKREKHKNPFLLNANLASLNAVVQIPDEIKNAAIHDDYAHKWIVDLFAAAENKRIQTDLHTVRQELDKLILERDKNKQEIEVLAATKERHSNTISEQKEKLAENSKHLKLLDYHKKEKAKELQLLRKERQEILNKLNTFIEEKAKVLLELGILDESTLNKMTGKKPQKEQPENGYSIQELGGIEQAIAHVQAYLHDKGIMYRRSVLQNFYTLLSSRDLIVLAGDSGSGKTNLVKSFAEAIGGKSYIIPVKPNWTSAEDLLGYYNPIEQNYLATPFLEALLEARNNPDVPHIICLDEMNLARVEYYFADFLSLLEERDKAPVIPLYSKTESSHLVNEARNFLALIDEAIKLEGKDEISSFIEILKDQKLNQKLHDLCGFKDGDSLLKYHTRLRKTFDSYASNPADITLPDNVFFVGAINVDETTHYLSPKILDRAHILRFTNPLLQDWDEIANEVKQYKEAANTDTSRKTILQTKDFPERASYPPFDTSDKLTNFLVEITKEYLVKLGIEFGLRTIRQAKNYTDLMQKNFSATENQHIINYIVRQKVLPKLTFDGESKVDGVAKKDILIRFRNYLSEQLDQVEFQPGESCVNELTNTINSAENNNWVINYWTR